MAVKRIWFPNIPSSGIDILDRSQVAIGYPFTVAAPALGPSDKSQVLIYLRRYLNDVITRDANVALNLPAPITTNNSVGGFWEVVKTDVRTYLRRYLNDT